MLIVILGPSGAGKTTVAEKLGLTELTSHTTRPVRTTEQGNEYHFVSEEEFDEIEFVETNTFNGYRYGVSVAELSKVLTSGDTYTVVIEENGYVNIKNLLQDKCVGVQLLLTTEQCMQRMFERGDSPSEIRERVLEDTRLNRYTERDDVDLVFKFTESDDIVAKLHKEFEL